MPIDPHDLDNPSWGLFPQMILACGKVTIKANHLAHNNRELQAQWKTLKQERWMDRKEWYLRFNTGVLMHIFMYYMDTRVYKHTHEHTHRDAYTKKGTRKRE